MDTFETSIYKHSADINVEEMRRKRAYASSMYKYVYKTIASDSNNIDKHNLLCTNNLNSSLITTENNYYIEIEI